MPNVSDRGLRAALAPIRRRLVAIAARAVVRLVDDSKARQLLQVEILKGELRDAVERLQDYGFTSHPLPGADAAVLSLSGSRDHAVAIVVADRRYRLQLEAGEVAMHDDQGNCVKLLRDKIRVEAVALVEIEAPEVRIIAPTVTIEGDTTFTGTVTANGKRIDDTHTHSGVQTGPGNTGTPN